MEKSNASGRSELQCLNPKASPASCAENRNIPPIVRQNVNRNKILSVMQIMEVLGKDIKSAVLNGNHWASKCFERKTACHGIEMYQG